MAGDVRTALEHVQGIFALFDGVQGNLLIKDRGYVRVDIVRLEVPRSLSIVGGFIVFYNNIPLNQDSRHLRETLRTSQSRLEDHLAYRPRMSGCGYVQKPRISICCSRAWWWVRKTYGT